MATEIFPNSIFWRQKLENRDQNPKVGCHSLENGYRNPKNGGLLSETGPRKVETGAKMSETGNGDLETGAPECSFPPSPAGHGAQYINRYKYRIYIYKIYKII